VPKKRQLKELGRDHIGYDQNYYEERDECVEVFIAMIAFKEIKNRRLFRIGLHSGFIASDAGALGRGGYNQRVSRLLPVCLTCLLILAACGNDLKTKEKVQAAILDRLQNHSGLDLKSIDVSTTNVTFENNLAYATVSFRPKGDPNLKSGMAMKYTLEAKDGKWVVTKVGDSAGHSMSNPAPSSSSSSTLPPGHPSLDQGASPANPHVPAPTQ
jgi:hypothetical protein